MSLTIYPVDMNRGKHFTYIHDTFKIEKQGHTNFWTIRPRMVNENFVLANDIISLNKDDQLIQIIKASDTNLTAAAIMASFVPQNTSITTIDNFETYTDSINLRNSWVSSNLSKTIVDLDTTYAYEGNQSMRVTLNKNSDGDTVTYTFDTLQNWVNETNLVFNWRQSQEIASISCRLQLEDNVGEKISHQIFINTIDTWTNIDLLFDSFDSDTNGIIDLQNIKYLRIIFDTVSGNERNIYIDDIYVYHAQAVDNLKVQLYEYNGTNEPTENDDLSNFTLLSNDNGDTYKTLSIISTVVKDTFIDLGEFGITDQSNTLTINNYYALVFTSITDDIINIQTYNGEIFQPYNSGKLFLSTIGSGFTEQTNTSMMFMVYSVRVCELTQIEFYFNEPPLDSKFWVGVCNSNGNVKQIIIDFAIFYNDSYIKIDLDADSELEIGDYLLIMSTHSNNSDITDFDFSIKCKYTPVEFNS